MGVIALNNRVKQLEEENKALQTQLEALTAYIPLLTTLSTTFARSQGVVTGMYLPQGDDTYVCELDESSGDIIWKFTQVVT